MAWVDLERPEWEPGLWRFEVQHGDRVLSSCEVTLPTASGEPECADMKVGIAKGRPTFLWISSPANSVDLVALHEWTQVATARVGPFEREEGPCGPTCRDLYGVWSF
ncbi:hypothetical protein [Vulgatibacter sp.]|uniref:hypothetical protein n=1 Tax=Vulgatibacter sp. TaxID=1971226 RepID=UPI0035619D66